MSTEVSSPAVALSSVIANDQRPLIAHIVYALDTGGLENGVVNLLNRLPADQFRHCIIAITTCSKSFSLRIERLDVEFYELRKAPGQTFWAFPALYRLLRTIRPQIVHTRNLAALETQMVARLVGIPVRIHGEHGWDIHDTAGTNLKRCLVRKAHRCFVHHYVALSQQIDNYLKKRVRIHADKITRICNGVDSRKFHPQPGRRVKPEGYPFTITNEVVFITIGRLQRVKNQIVLVQAFARLSQELPNQSIKMRLVIVGGGPLQAQLQREIERLHMQNRIWLAGDRADIPALLQAAHVFVLPSLAEGISNTILEAMACGLAVIATDVGGNQELVKHNVTGLLVKPNAQEQLQRAMAAYVNNPERLCSHGQQGRKRIEVEFGLEKMVDAYAALYRQQLQRAGLARKYPAPFKD